MSHTPYAPKKATVAFILVVVIIDIIALGIVVPIFPYLIEDFVHSTANAGILNGVFIAIWAIMQFFASPVLGSLSDRFGRRPVILISTVGLALDYVLIALAPNLWWLFIGRILGGLTSASIGTVYAYMADITPVEHRAKAFGLIGAAFSFGFVIGPVVGGLIGEISLKAPFWTAAAFSSVTFLYGLFVLPESLPQENQTAFSWKRANPIGALTLLMSQRKLFFLAIINFLVNFCGYVFHAVFVLYTGYRFGFTPLHVGAVLALTAVLDIIVQAGLVGISVKYFKNEGTLVLGLLIGSAGTVMLALAPTAPLLILALFPQALWGLATPTIQALMTACVSETQQGQLQGANTSLVAIAGMIAPVLFGSIYALFISQWRFLNLPGAPFLVAAVLLAFAASLGWRIIRQKM